ncbi:MAG: hypothetical protein H7336_03500 [Bacteriovorax sp.]|nr:hypothetical protein [Bacteriovorax sp.]
MEKLKKSIPYLLIVLLVVWFSYKFFIERPIPKEPSMKLDWDQLDATSGSKPEDVPVTIKKDNNLVKPQATREHSEISKSDEDQFAEYDAMEKEWLGIVMTIVGEKFYPTYLEMRDNNEKEKMVAYKEYHDYLRKKYGDKFSYNISEDQSVREKEINQKYLKMLLDKIGTEKFQAYIKARDVINEENRRKKKLFVQIEF